MNCFYYERDAVSYQDIRNSRDSVPGMCLSSCCKPDAYQYSVHYHCYKPVEYVPWVSHLKSINTKIPKYQIRVPSLILTRGILNVFAIPWASLDVMTNKFGEQKFSLSMYIMADVHSTICTTTTPANQFRYSVANNASVMTRQLAARVFHIISSM